MQIIALFRKKEKPPAIKADWFYWVAIILLMLTAATRMWDLGTTPMGMTQDELANAEIASWLRGGYVSVIYDEIQPAREFVYYSLLAGFTAVAGDNGIIVWRLPSVWISLVTLALSARLMRSLFNERIALLALGLMAVLFWPVWLGRSVLHVTLVPFITTLTAYTVMRALRAGGRGSAALWYTFAGICLGVSQYVHVICWTLILFFFLYLLATLLTDSQYLKERWINIVYMLLLMLIIMTPLFIYLSSNPGVRDRVPLADQPGMVAELPGRFISAIAGLGLRGDILPWHNLPGRPVLGPVCALLFLVGLGVCIARVRQREYMAVLIWLAVGFLPSLFLPQKSDFEYMSVLLPILFIFPSIALYELFLLTTRADRLRISRDQVETAFTVTAFLMITVNLFFTYRDFFVRWPDRADVREAYLSEIGAIAHYLDIDDEETPVAVCSGRLREERDAKALSNREILAYMMHREDLPIRYFDCRRSLVLMDGGSEQRIFFPRGHFYDLPGKFQPWMDDAEDIGIRYVSSDVAVRVDIETKLADFAGGLMTLSPTAWPPEIGDFRLAELPVRFGYNLAFLGYDLRNPELRPGDYIEVATYWRMDGPPPPQLVQFTHLLGSPFVVLAQNDSIGVDVGTLQSRDVFMEYILIQVPSAISEGYYSLSTGMYFPDTNERLPAFEEGNYIADRLFIEQVHITR